ncbi:MAG TPA: hypothetical protein VIW45_21460 [Vicinamibacterales bacterium]
MKKLAFASALVVCSATAIALAQSTTTSSSSSSSKANRVTVTGCVERGSMPSSETTGTTGTTGSSASTTHDAKFILTKVSSGLSTTTGTTGTTSPSVATPLQYRLDDSEQSRVSPHVGQKVEITGTVEDHDRTSASSVTGTTSGAPSTRVSPTLKVETIRTIASTCASE